MAGLLDFLGLAGAPQMAQAGADTSSTPVATVPAPNSGPQDIQTVQVIAPRAGPVGQVLPATPVSPGPNLTPVSPSVSGLDTSVPNLSVAPPTPYVPHTVPQGVYDNNPELSAINQVKQGYPDTSVNTPGVGQYVPSSLPGAGTLRSMLGTLGDAFLIAGGKQPLHRQQDQANQIAQASAGFDQDPGGAAARIASTGAPGSMQDAQGMYNAYQNEQLRQATLQNTAAYRDSVMADRTQNHQALQQMQQDKTDDRNRSLFGARLAAVANNPQQYAATRAAIAQQVAKMPNTGINPDVEFPEDPKQFNAGYGLNANQYARNQNAQQALSVRQDLGQQNVNARYAGIGAGVRNNNARVAATERGQDTSMPGQIQAIADKVNNNIPLQPGETALWNKATHVGGAGGRAPLAIPGLTPSAPIPPANRTGFPAPGPTATPAAAPHQQAPIVHTYPSGRKAVWDGRQWKAMN